jgi:hypothetical protein
LEHDHIVRVFSEELELGGARRLLCMQYVPGLTLEQVIQGLGRRDRGSLSGRSILEVLEERGVDNTRSLDPAALRDYETLVHCDFPQAVCWLGARVAEALGYAHRRGVLHRDVKPANILLNNYGRPLLADFNIAAQSRGPKAEELFGGTIRYMAPEHLEAFNPDDPTPSTAVTEQSDIYSLGVVLFELLTGRKPFKREPGKGTVGAALTVLAAERRSAAPSPRQVRTEIPEALDRVIRRCLQPSARRRYQKAVELARALDGCRELRRVERDLPRPGVLSRAALARPFLVLVGLTLIPHFIGSLVNVTYNGLIIGLTSAQEVRFSDLVVGYNAVVYPLTLWGYYRLVRPVFHTWRRLAGSQTPDKFEMAIARRRALNLPLWVAVLSCVGWLPGGLLFPLGLHWLAGVETIGVLVHFIMSFTVAGLIALTYSVFGVQFVVLRVFYPRFSVDTRRPRQMARRELAGLVSRLRHLQLLAGLIPLMGAALMIGAGPEQFNPVGYTTFRWLVFALMALGMVGFALAVTASDRLHQILMALIGSHRPPRVLR